MWSFAALFSTDSQKHHLNQKPKITNNKKKVAVLEEISRGEALFAAAQRALLVMRRFVDAQRAQVAARRPLPLELLCALLNNNLECYAQSLEFAEHVQVFFLFWVVFSVCVCSSTAAKSQMPTHNTPPHTPSHTHPTHTL